MSLMPRSRLIIDSHRSPSVAVATTATPSTAPCQGLPCSMKSMASAPAAAASTIEPASPSQDFFGEIFGAIGCRPNSTPEA